MNSEQWVQSKGSEHLFLMSCDSAPLQKSPYLKGSRGVLDPRLLYTRETCQEISPVSKANS